MKLNGISVEPPEPKTIVIPHGDQEVVFKAQLVDDFTEFDELCPRPTPPVIRDKEGNERRDISDKDYLQRLNDYSEKRSNWMFLKSLLATEGLEFDIVDMSDPETWNSFDDEFKAAGFSEYQIERIKLLAFQANGMDQKLIDEATERFLAGRAQESKNETSQNTEH